MRVSPQPPSQSPWWSKFQPSPTEPGVVIDPDSVHFEDSKPCAYSLERLEHPTRRQQAFESTALGYFSGTGALIAGAGALSRAALGPWGIPVAAVAGAAARAYALDGISPCQQDRRQLVRAGLVQGALIGAAGAALPSWTGVLAGTVVGAVTTPLG